MTKPDSHGESQYTLNNRPVEMSHGYFTDPELFELPQEIKSLVGFANLKTGVEIPR